MEALFAAVRIALWFVLLFGFIAPLFLVHLRNLPIIEKLIYSWVGLGGILIFSIFVLSIFQIYDFISIVLTLVLIPFVRSLWQSDASNILNFLNDWERRTLVKHIQIIEKKDFSLKDWLKRKLSLKKNWNRREGTKNSVIIGIALAGGIIRMVPALQNAAPFSRGWFIHLNRVKNIRLQDYFSGFPEPGGMHSLVSVFSMLTQISPEMILHELGALSSFFLCIIIYWCTKDITQNRYPLAPIFGMAIYALSPMLFMPISLDQQIEAGSLDLALCFALPTLTIFIRNLRSRFESPYFYVLAGFVATAMVNLFVALIILLPLMFLGLLYVSRSNYLRSLFRITGYLFVMGLGTITPFLIACYIYEVELQTFLLSQFYIIESYSYYPFLILPMDDLSLIYLRITGVLFILYLLIGSIKKNGIRDELIFLIIFLFLSLSYTPFMDVNDIIWLDIDQFNGFYAVMIAIFGGIIFSAIMEFIDMLCSASIMSLRISSWVLFITAIGCLAFVQGGVKVSRSNPNTIPNGFLEAYHQIINERLPYSYATVGPNVKGIMARNRNYFMDYNYFLDEYSTIDSLYRQSLQLPVEERIGNSIPPASIFVFTERSPYSSIQQGILYDSPSVMREVEQWIENFRELPGRRVDLYYSDSNTLVYEIINREKESKIKDVLYHIYPEKKRKRLFNY